MDETLGVKGIPIPYGAPNAAAYVERFIGTLRRECLVHFVFVSESHLRRSVAEFADWFEAASQCFTLLCGWNLEGQLFGVWYRGVVAAFPRSVG